MRVIKSRRMRCAVYAARMRVMRNACRILFVKCERMGHLGDIDMHGGG
jgi:hypothetical protein